MRKLILLLITILGVTTSSYAALPSLPDPGTPNFSRNMRIALDTWKQTIEANQQFIYSGGVPDTGTSYINVMTPPYNAVPNDGVDDSDAIQAAIDDAVNTAKFVFIPSGIWDVAKTLNVPSSVSVGGNGTSTEIRTMSSGVYVGNYVIRCNRVANDEGVDDTNFNKEGVALKNFKLSNVNAESTHNYAMYIGDRRILDSITTAYFYKGVSYTTAYLDRKLIKRCQFFMSKSDGTDGYFIDFRNLGDGIVMSNSTVGYRNDGSVPENVRFAVRISESHGGFFYANVINGTTYVEKSDGVTFDSNHSEAASLAGTGGINPRSNNWEPTYILDSNRSVTIRNQHLQVGGNPGIRITRDRAAWKGRILLDNITFVHVMNKDYPDSNDGVDVDLIGQFVTVRNCYRSVYVGSTSVATTTGIVITKNGGTPISEFNAYSYFLSDYVKFQYDDIRQYSRTVNAGEGTPSATLNGILTNAGIKWRAATGTYYYTASIVYDPLRMIGQTVGTILSQAVTADGDGIALTALPGVYFSNNYILRLYRGVASGVYDNYVDIPIQYLEHLYDNGETVNGFPWLTNSVAGGGVHQLNTFGKRITFTFDTADIVTGQTVAAPVYGNWKIGDVIQSESGDTRIYCTASGLPGKWAAQNQLITLESQGAVGDNVTNDSAAILSAFQLGAATGKTVYADGGKTYYMGSTVALTSADVGSRGFKFVGGGSTRSATFRFDGTGYAFSFTGTGNESASPFRGLQLDNLTVTTNAGNTTSDGGIYIDKAYSVKLTNVVSTGWEKVGAIALSLRNAFNATVEGGHFANSINTLTGVGIQLGSLDSGADTWNTSNIKITDAIIQYSLTGLDIRQEANVGDNFVIENNSIGKNYTSLECTAVNTGVIRSVTIKNNHFESSGYSYGTTSILADARHIYVGDTNGVDISGNDMKDSATYIDLQDVESFDITNNYIYESGNYTITTSTGIHISEPTGTTYGNIGPNKIRSDQINNYKPVIDDGSYVVQFGEEQLGIFNVMKYGANPNDGVNDSVQFQNAIDDAALVSGIVYIPSGDWNLYSTLQVPYNVSLDGAGSALIADGGTRLLTMSGGNYVDGFLIRFNRTAADTSWDTPYPNITSFVRNIKISNTSFPTTVNNALYVADRRIIEDLRIEYFHRGIAYTGEYLDGKNIRRVKCAVMQSSTNYVINTGWLGDGIIIDQLSVNFDPAVLPADRKVLYMKGPMGGSVTNSILNGEVFVVDTSNVVFSGNHSELYDGQNGYIFDNAAGIKLQDSFIGLGSDTTVPGVRIRRTGSSMNLPNIILDHVGFYRNSRSSGNFKPAPAVSTSDTLLTIRDCYVTYSFGASNETNTMGIDILNNDTGLPIDDFNNRSAWLSKYCQIRDTTVVDYSPITIIGGTGAPLYSIATIQASNKITFTKPTGTYYYKIQALYDIDRALGATTEEESISLTNGASSALLLVNLSTGYNRQAMYKIYRGTSTNSYDSYAIVPGIYAYFFYDGGNNINGIEWQSRTAGPVDALNADMQQKILATKDNVVVYAPNPTVPAVGTWNQGDMIKDYTPTSGTPTLELCTGSGSVGIWVSTTGI